jgi:transposase
MDHIPLARQEAIFARQGIALSRKTMCDWMAACAAALTPIYTHMLNRVLKSRVIHCDETRVPVQDIGQTRSGRLWVYLGDRDHPFTVYDYRTTKARAGPAEILRNYRGYLHADAANVFDGLYKPGAIVEVGCWAHARRHVHAALSSDAALAAQALTRIAGLYRVEHAIAAERETQGLTGDSADAFTLAARQRDSRPQLEALKAWIDEVQPQTLPKSPIHQGFAYILRHWEALNRYTAEGFLAIDNNSAERGFRPIGIGRRNWLFAGSDAGGRTAAVLFSLTQTCRDHGVDPWKYLKDTLKNLPTTLPDQIASLMPVA